LEVIYCGPERFRVISEGSEASIARSAEEASDVVRLVVVVDCQEVTGIGSGTADSTDFAISLY
jgi:hypothetical protein